MQREQSTEIVARGTGNCFGLPYTYCVCALVVLIVADVGEGLPCAQGTHGSASVLLGGLVVPDPGRCSMGTR